MSTVPGDQSWSDAGVRPPDPGPDGGDDPTDPDHPRPDAVRRLDDRLGELRDDLSRADVADLVEQATEVPDDDEDRR